MSKKHTKYFFYIVFSINIGLYGSLEMEKTNQTLSKKIFNYFNQTLFPTYEKKSNTEDIKNTNINKKQAPFNNPDLWDHFVSINTHIPIYRLKEEKNYNGDDSLNKDTNRKEFERQIEKKYNISHSFNTTEENNTYSKWWYLIMKKNKENLKNRIFILDTIDPIYGENSNYQRMYQYFQNFHDRSFGF
jgi:hypothetical protein